MKTIYLTLITLLISTVGFTQNEAYNGTITDNMGQTLDRAYVLVLNADDLSYVTGTVTDEEGNFEFVDLEDGDYVLSVDHISFEEPKILGNLNTEININNLDKLNLKYLGSELILDSADDQLALHVDRASKK